jgi:hypothetical protein
LQRLQRADYCLGRKAMANRIATGTLFALFRDRTGAFASITAIGFDLPEGCRH